MQLNTNKQARCQQLALITVVAALVAGCNPAYMNSNNSRSFSRGTKCPSDNMLMHFNGKTAVEWGKLMKQYSCPAGHRYWYASNKPLRNTAVKDPCPICGSGTIFTGKTRVEWGKLQRIHRCPVGHISVKTP